LNENIPAGFICSITAEPFQDPVMLGNTGHSFERRAIEQWLRTPKTATCLYAQRLTPNISLREAIEAIVQGSAASKVFQARELTILRP
jgi:hypothetical protein